MPPRGSRFHPAQILHQAHPTTPLHTKAIPQGLPHVLQIFEAQDLINSHRGLSQLLGICQEALLTSRSLENP